MKAARFSEYRGPDTKEMQTFSLEQTAKAQEVTAQCRVMGKPAISMD
ncbi:hypothetical protein [Rhizobium miluonense]|nr:hypothetical protein [Rhizobium miluonense]